MKNLVVFLSVSLLLVAGCALPKPGVSMSMLEQIDKGASHGDVVRVFGSPHYLYSKGNTEFMLYGIDDDGDGKADTRNRIVLMLVDGKLYDKGVDVYGEEREAVVEESPVPTE